MSTHTTNIAKYRAFVHTTHRFCYICIMARTRSPIFYRDLKVHGIPYQITNPVTLACRRCRIYPDTYCEQKIVTSPSKDAFRWQARKVERIFRRNEAHLHPLLVRRFAFQCWFLALGRRGMSFRSAERRLEILNYSMCAVQRFLIEQKYRPLETDPQKFMRRLMALAKMHLGKQRVLESTYESH